MNVFQDAWSDEPEHRKYRRTPDDILAEQASEQAFNNLEMNDWRNPNHVQHVGTMAIVNAEPVSPPQEAVQPPFIEHHDVA